MSEEPRESGGAGPRARIGPALALAAACACNGHGVPVARPAAPAPAPAPAEVAAGPSRLEALRARIAGSSLAELARLAGPEAELDGLDPPALAEVGALLWRRRLEELRADAARLAEHRARAIRLGDAVMRFEHAVIGERPGPGYPLYIALHGGGGAPTELNDAQWEHMKVYYRDSVDVGVYAAVRGISDTWDLHFREASYPLYDRLIEDMIAYADVDPNRVYLLGFSAGGDGVYQITPRMADRWAAANMSAGHPNGVSLDNVVRVPFLIQVGELDAAYDRNRVAAAYCGTLRALRQAHPDGYVHDCFIHLGRPHNFRDNDASRAPQAVLADPVAWRERGDRTSVRVDTNAVAWLRRFVRDPWPARLVWDVETARPRLDAAAGPDAAPRARLFYWLARGEEPGAGPERVVARLDRASNTVHVEQAGASLRIRLRGEMLDLDREVRIVLPGGELRTHVRPDLATMARTLLERGDPHHMFAVEIAVTRAADGAWSLAGGR